MVSPPNFDHEKLDVYQLELKFLTWVTQFLAEICGPLSAQTREIREQLDRASLSALLNTAEGNGRRQGRQRAKFFDDARGSAIECAACLDASVAKGFAFFGTNSTRQRNLGPYCGYAYQTGRALRSRPIPGGRGRIRPNCVIRERGRGRRRARGRIE